VTKEPEKVLVKNGVTPAVRVKEHGFEITVHKKHSNRSREYRQRKK
jgi:hypothetical protein